MSDRIYCYPDSDVLINKFNIRDKNELLKAEAELTFVRLVKLQKKPIDGEFDFIHLKNIHRYIFKNIYSWAGEVRTVEIGKGNLFCTTRCIQSYADSVFAKYFSQCYKEKDNINNFISVFAENYGDLNALHPFRDGNGRAQREFARVLCLKCGYDFDLSCTTHTEMLKASKLSFNTGDSSGLAAIFTKAIHPLGQKPLTYTHGLKILTADDFKADKESEYDCLNETDTKNYDKSYEAKISEMQNKVK